jgi:large repetitive protein
MASWRNETMIDSLGARSMMPRWSRKICVLSIGLSLQLIAAVTGTFAQTNPHTSQTTALMSLTPASLPAGLINTPYASQTFSVTNGTAPFTWIQTGTLPPGLRFTPSASTATLSGTPTVAGTYDNITVSVRDSSATPMITAQTFSITINGSGSVHVAIDGSTSSSRNVARGGMLTIKAAVSGATPNLSFTVSGIANGNAAVGIITGAYPTYIYISPVAIPANNNPVTIVATQRDTSQTASLTVTILPSPTTPNPISVAGGNVTGINFNLSSMTTTLSLADIGTCVSGECTASVTGISASASGLATASCPAGNDVNVDGATLAGMTPSGNMTYVTFNIDVSPTAAIGVRNLVVTVSGGATKQTATYIGAIQIVQ